MFAKQSLVALCAAATIGQAAAGVFHRHADHHAQHLQKKAIVTDIVVITDYVTVYVTEGQEPTAPAAAAIQETVVVNPSSPSEASVASAAVAATPATPAAVAPTTAAAAVVAPAAPTTFASVVKQVQSATAEVAAQAAPAPAAAAPAVSVGTVMPGTPSMAVGTVLPAPTKGTGALGVKRGLAYNDATLLTLLTSKSSWAYNWGSTADGTIPSGMEYVPMLWGPGSDKTSIWKANADKAIASGSSYLMSFNEPDNPGQANISPAVAAAGHKQWMNPYAGKAKIGAPAISSQADPGFGLDWLKQWKTACNGACSFDFCNVHWYGLASQHADFIKFVKDSIDMCDGKPVWVTEFATTGGDAVSFMNTVVPQLDALDGVERYSYFMLSVGSLVSNGRALSDLGVAYNTL